MIRCVELELQGDKAVEDLDILNNVFNQFLETTPIFRDREVLRHDYIPNKLPHREVQIRYLGEIATPVLLGSRCSNIFIYGKTGTGKTAVIKYVLSRLTRKAQELGAPIKVCYINCRFCWNRIPNLVEFV